MKQMVTVLLTFLSMKIKILKLLYFCFVFTTLEADSLNESC